MKVYNKILLLFTTVGVPILSVSHTRNRESRLLAGNGLNLKLEHAQRQKMFAG